jgi:isoleucyl-tRNA synthetase
VTRAFEKYELDKVLRPFDLFIDDLSTWYARRSRDRLKKKDATAIKTMREVLLGVSKLLAPITPFLAENIYKTVDGTKVSVHLETWPTYKKFKLLNYLGIFGDKKILLDMKEVRRIVYLALEIRARANIKVRQPLKRLSVLAGGRKLSDDLIRLIKEEVNVKEVVFSGKQEEPVILDTNISADLQIEGWVRDFVRAIQEARKKSGFVPNDQICLNLVSPEEWQKIVTNNLQKIISATNSSTIVFVEVLSGEINDIKIGDFLLKFSLGK